jgi:hypothetical protein
MANLEGGKQAEARYANHFKVGHTAFEFILEFGQFYSGESEPEPHTRIVTSPAYASSLLILLQDSLTRYEMTFGTPSPDPRHE